jgi:hypothetical protein
MVRAIMIVEMAGRPAEHLTASIEKHIGVLNEVKDIKVHSIKVSEPREIEIDEMNGVEKGEKMFSVFAEADFECESFARLTETMFDFMPSSVEVLEPTRVTMDLNESTNLLNTISGRMHRYDEVAKIAGARLQQMNTQLQMAKNILTAKDMELAKFRKKTTKKKVAKKTKPKKKVAKKVKKK